MLAQHLDDPALAGEMNVIGLKPLHPDAIGGLEHGVEAIGRRLVGA